MEKLTPTELEKTFLLEGLWELSASELEILAKTNCATTYDGVLASKYNLGNSSYLGSFESIPNTLLEKHSKKIRAKIINHLESQQVFSKNPNESSWINERQLFHLWFGLKNSIVGPVPLVESKNGTVSPADLTGWIEKCKEQNDEFVVWLLQKHSQRQREVFTSVPYNELAPAASSID